MMQKSSSNYSEAIGVQGFLTVDPQASDAALVASDFDDDGKSDPTLYRRSIGRWEIWPSGTNYTIPTLVTWGTGIDIPVPGDYDRDGKADPTFYRPSNNSWHVLTSTTTYATSFTVFRGNSGDVPVPSDYDADDITDLALFRPSTNAWLIVESSGPHLQSGQVAMSGSAVDLRFATIDVSQQDVSVAADWRFPSSTMTGGVVLRWSDRIRVEAAGTVLRVYWDNEFVFVVTDTEAPPGTAAGLASSTTDASVPIADNFVVDTNRAPEVAIDSPLNGASFLGPNPIAIAATATDPDGSIDHVEFYANLSLLGTDATPPFALTYNAPRGIYAIRAVAYDNFGGMTASAPHTVTVSCTFAMAPQSRNIVAGGAQGSLALTSENNGCVWTATTHAHWIHLTGTVSGEAAGTISYTVDANTDTVPRTGRITAGGQTFMITQDAACSFRVEPTSVTIAGTGTSNPPIAVTVVSGVGCSWSASSDTSWLDVAGGKTGDGNATYSVDPSCGGGAAPYGTMQVAGQTVFVQWVPGIQAADPATSRRSVLKK